MKKKLWKCSFIISFALLTYACKRDNIKPENVSFAKVLVFNGLVGSGSLKVSVSPQDKYWNSILDEKSLFNKGSMVFIAPEGENMVKATELRDTTKILYKNRVRVQDDSFYTLYLTGTAIDIDTLFRKEDNLPKVPPLDIRKKLTAQDSIINIRFINLSYNGPKVNINMLNNTHLEVSGLGYQEFTDFKAYSATSNSIVFEIRKTADQSLLFTYTLNSDFYRFKTLDIAIAGSYDPSVPFLDRYGIAEIPLL